MIAVAPPLHPGVVVPAVFAGYIQRLRARLDYQAVAHLRPCGLDLGGQPMRLNVTSVIKVEQKVRSRGVADYQVRLKGIRRACHKSSSSALRGGTSDPSPCRGRARPCMLTSTPAACPGPGL